MNFSDQESYEKKFKRKLSYEEAKIKAASFCAYQERYQQEVRNKLFSYGLNSPDVEDLLSYLISEGFVNEERFAIAFAGGKFRMKKWGRIKIENELSQRKISPYCIRKALATIEDQEYIDTIHFLIERKSAALSGWVSVNVKKKIADYLVRKGFESALVWDILNDKISN